MGGAEGKALSTWSIGLLVNVTSWCRRVCSYIGVRGMRNDKVGVVLGTGDVRHQQRTARKGGASNCVFVLPGGVDAEWCCQFAASSRCLLSPP